MFHKRLTYSFEFERKLKIGLVGCGGQSFRNLIPTFQYAPIELIATCDINTSRAQAFARQFGALNYYSDLLDMINTEDLDAVLLSTGYSPDGHPLYPKQAGQVLRSGCHVWIEKPPAASVQEIEELHEIEQETGKKVGVGFMKMFSPGAAKIKSIMEDESFGRPTSLYLRDPEMLPPFDKRSEPKTMKFFLDHIVHPVSLIHFLMGPLSRIYVQRGIDGACIISLGFVSGACGALHLPWGQSGMSPMERLEVVGEGTNVVLENNIRLIYYRPGNRGHGEYEYGRIGDFTSANGHAPLLWEIDCYSGQPYNMHIFSQGYAQEILYFSQCILHDEPILIGGLADAWHIMRFFEAVKTAQSSPIDFKPAPAWSAKWEKTFVGS